MKSARLPTGPSPRSIARPAPGKRFTIPSVHMRRWPTKPPSEFLAVSRGEPRSLACGLIGPSSQAGAVKGCRRRRAQRARP